MYLPAYAVVKVNGEYKCKCNVCGNMYKTSSTSSMAKHSSRHRLQWLKEGSKPIRCFSKKAGSGTHALSAWLHKPYRDIRQGSSKFFTLTPTDYYCVEPGKWVASFF